MFGLGADPLDAVRFDHFGEMRIFGQEAIAGVDGVRAADLGSRDDRRNRQIAVGRSRRADADRLIGEPHVHRVGIGGAVHGDGFDAEFLGRAQNPQGNFPAIGNQDFFDGHGAMPPCRSCGAQVKCNWRSLDFALDERSDLTIIYAITTSGWSYSIG